MKTPTDTMVAQSFWPVNTHEKMYIGSSLPSMTHHKSYRSHNDNIIVKYDVGGDKGYGVSSDYRILTKGVFQKRFDQIRSFLHNVLKLPDGEVEAVLILLRLWAYYGNVYPTAACVASEAYCSKSTFWRAVRNLKALGLIETVPRYVLRVHAQISNLYKLKKLVMVIARYLAEHIAHIWPDWFKPYLCVNWPDFWRSLNLCFLPGSRGSPDG